MRFILTNSPKVTLVSTATVSRYFEKALVKTQIVPDWVLPTLFIFLVIWKICYNKRVNFAQRESLVFTAFDCHCDEGHVTVRWFCITRVVCLCNGTGCCNWIVSRGAVVIAGIATTSVDRRYAIVAFTVWNTRCACVSYDLVFVGVCAAVVVIVVTTTACCFLEIISYVQRRFNFSTFYVRDLVLRIE